MSESGEREEVAKRRRADTAILRMILRGDPAETPRKIRGGKGGFGRIALAGLLWSFWESFRRSCEVILRAILPKNC